MNMGAKVVYDELVEAMESNRPMPFVIQSGAFEVRIEDTGDLILAVKGFKRMAANEQEAASFDAEGVVTR